MGLAAAASEGFAADQTAAGYQAAAVPLADVDIKDAFWRPRIENARSVALPDLLNRSRGRNFVDGRLIEAASYFPRKQPDAELQHRVDSLLDGSIASLRSREHTWPNRGDGSTSGAGTFFEGAVASRDATGSRKLLDVAVEVADDLDATFGPGKRYDISNHEGVEIGLTKLYAATDNDRYLKLAKFMVDTRGTRAGGREEWKPVQAAVPYGVEKDLVQQSGIRSRNRLRSPPGGSATAQALQSGLARTAGRELDARRYHLVRRRRHRVARRFLTGRQLRGALAAASEVRRRERFSVNNGFICNRMEILLSNDEGLALNKLEVVR